MEAPRDSTSELDLNFRHSEIGGRRTKVRRFGRFEEVEVGEEEESQEKGRR